MNLTDMPLLSMLPWRSPSTERRRATMSGSSLLMRMLDEIDYGLMLVAADGRLRYANRLALLELAAGGPLRLTAGLVCVQPEAELGRLRAALTDAARGLRTLVKLGHNANTLLLAVIPMDGEIEPSDAPTSLLVFSKREACAELTVAFYARSNGLTATESSVLLQLSQGVKPKDIAGGHGVALSTVRSQISSIRAKTHTASIRDLTSRVAALPPFASALKSTPAGGGDASPASVH